MIRKKWYRYLSSTVSPNESSFQAHDCNVPVRTKPSLASVTRADADDTGSTPIHLEPAGADRSARIANLILRVDTIRIGLAGEQQKRRARISPPAPQAQTPAPEPPQPHARADIKRPALPAHHQSVPKFTRWPEVILSVVAAISLWLLASAYGDDLDDVSTAATLSLALAVPFALAIFICGGAALWRAFREL